jgi:hypothetical protein
VSSLRGSLQLCTIILAVILTGIWEAGKQYILIIAVCVVIIIFTLRQVIKYQRRKAITSEIDRHLKKALETMDTTARWYNNEEEANRKLVTCLKAQGINDVIYQYKLKNGRTVDAKFGDCLIEGKLSPSTDEIDRLIGQISDYVQYANKLNIVIYGLLDREAKRRIEQEIQSRYLNKVFLTYLDEPRRQRSP